MFGFGKNSTKDSSAQAGYTDKPGVFTRLKDKLARTRATFTDGLASLVLGGKNIDADLLEEIEMLLISADVGVDASERLINGLRDRLKRKQLNDAETLMAALREDMQVLLTPVSIPMQVPKQTTPYVIFMVGVNGVGKTTTTGKLAKRLQAEGHRVMLAAADTFRAAAVEQLQVWGERNDIQVVAQATGADAASVAYDALDSARAKGIDVLIVDTAGRLHTQQNLMEELKKIKRVLGKLDASAPHEVMLTVDGGTGQNAISQAQQFNQAVGLTGINITKLDGTAKGGVIFALAEQLGVPVRFIGVGEGIDDLREFDARSFVEALFADTQTNAQVDARDAD